MSDVSKIRLVATDFDGTLAQSPRIHITERTIESLTRVREYGIRFAVLTGRSPWNVRDILGDYGIDTGDVYVAGFNGGIVLDPQGTVIYRRALSTDVARVALDLISEYPELDSAVYGESVVFTRQLAGDISRYEQEVNKALVRESATWEEAFVDPVSKLTIYAPPKAEVHLAELVEALRRVAGETIEVVYSASTIVDVTPEGVNKGAALAAIGAAVNIPLHSIAAVGDSENDLPMLRIAGQAIAMGNASQHLKEVADVVTDSSNDDGVARYLESLVSD